MDEKQTKMWDTLAELDGEEVLRVLTDWHGLRLLDDGFYGHMVYEGYIDEPDGEEEETNCEAGTYDCNTCPMSGGCSLQEAMETAVAADNFDDFCDQFPKCRGCPMSEMDYRPCKEEHWFIWRKEHGYGV